MQETWVPSLGPEDPLEKEMATHSGILACGIPWTEEPGRLYSPWDCKRVRHDLVTKQQQPLILEYFNWQHTEDVKKKKKTQKQQN